MFQSTLNELADAFAREAKSVVIPKGAAFAIPLGEGCCLLTPISDPAPGWVEWRLVYPPGVQKDWRAGTPIKRYPIKTTRGWDIWNQTHGLRSIYADDLKRANYRRGSDDEITLDQGSGSGAGLALQQRLQVVDPAGSAESGPAVDPRREAVGAPEVDSEPRRDDADAAPAELQAVPRPVPGSLGDEAEGVLVTNERKRARNKRQSNKLKKRVQSQAELNVGLANWAPPKVGRPKMAFFYVRFSSLEQSKGYSEALQTEAIERLFQFRLAAEGYERAPRVYLDAGQSAYKIAFGNREMGRQLLADVQQGDAILVYKLDRCFRQVKDSAATCELLRDRGVRLLACDFDVDYTTATGTLMMNLLTAVAQWESQVKGERTRDGLRSSLRKGKGDPRAMPYFCERVTYRTRRVPVVRESFVDLIDWASRAIRDGKTYAEVSKQAAKEAAILEGRKPCVGETYGFGVDRLKHGLGEQLREWYAERAARIRVGDEVRFVWMPVKKGVEVEA